MNSLFERAPNDPKRVHLNPIIKFALELGPLLIFFFVNSWYDIFAATAAFMIAITIALATSWMLIRRLAIIPVISGVFVLTFGGLTLYFHNELFMYVKPTILNSLFGLILLGGLLFDKVFLAYVFDGGLELSTKGWRLLTLRWGIFFFFLALLNELVWRNFSKDFWVTFKVYGILPITLVFTFFQIPLIVRHSVVEPSEEYTSNQKS